MTATRLVHRPFWRRGFATEAACACRDYAFDALGRQRVIALIRPENADNKPKAVIKEGLSEYFLFTIEGREDIKDKEPL